MMKRLILLLLALLVASVAYAGEHPVFYIDKGACPFECCRYGKWGVEKTVKLYAEPKTDSRFIGYARQGETINAETGEVHTKPGKFVVKRDVDKYKKGDVLWVYTYVGEGFYKVWLDGKLAQEDIRVDYRNPKPDDWGFFEIPPKSVWWVKIRTKKGLAGWANQTDNFSRRDACE